VISDEGSHIAAAYGCQGKDYTKRVVYVIDRDGKVVLGEAGMVSHEKIFAALDGK
jgi:peroxiredoxin